MAERITISVLMASYNRLSSLNRTLMTFQQIETEGLDWELLVINNGDGEDIAPVLGRYSRSLPVVYLRERKLGKAPALNLGLSRARGSLLVFTDDDVEPEPDWLERLAQAAIRWPEDGVFAGRIEPRFPPGTPPWIEDYTLPLATMAFVRYDPQPGDGPTEHTPFGPNFAVRANLMDGVRFDERLGPRGAEFPMGEETLLLRRLARRFIYVRTAVIHHIIEPHQLTLEWLCGRARRFGRGQAYAFPDENATRLFGAPRWLWRRWLEACVPYALSAFQSDPARCQAGMTCYRWWGLIQEHRRIRQKAGVAEHPVGALRSKV